MVVIKLTELIDKIRKINSLDIPSSSLLILYDSKCFSKSNILEEYSINIPKEKLKVKLIDFSYFEVDEKAKLIVKPDDSQQKNIIDALENIIEFLNSLS